MGVMWSVYLSGRGSQRVAVFSSKLFAVRRWLLRLLLLLLLWSRLLSQRSISNLTRVIRCRYRAFALYHSCSSSLSPAARHVGNLYTSVGCCDSGTARTGNEWRNAGQSES